MPFLSYLLDRCCCCSFHLFCNARKTYFLGCERDESNRAGAEEGAEEQKCGLGGVSEGAQPEGSGVGQVQV